MTLSLNVTQFLGRKSELQLQNSVLDFKTFQGMKKKWPDSKTHILTDATIKSYFYLQLIEDKMPGLKNATVCEIGPGTGNMASLFYHHFNNKLFLVDLPRTFFFSFTFLAQSYPTARIALPNEVADKNFDPQNYDIIMLTPQQTSHIKNQSVDLTVNVHSMQEMNDEAIYSYFDLVDRISKPGGGSFFVQIEWKKSWTENPYGFLIIRGDPIPAPPYLNLTL